MFIKKFFIISCLLSLLIACDNNKKTKHLEKKINQNKLLIKMIIILLKMNV